MGNIGGFAHEADDDQRRDAGEVAAHGTQTRNQQQQKLTRQLNHLAASLTLAEVERDELQRRLLLAQTAIRETLKDPNLATTCENMTLLQEAITDG